MRLLALLLVLTSACQSWYLPKTYFPTPPGHDDTVDEIAAVLLLVATAGLVYYIHEEDQAR